MAVLIGLGLSVTVRWLCALLRSLKRLERKSCGSQVNSESNQESDPNVVYKFTCHPESGFNLTCVSWWPSSLFKPKIVYKCKSNAVAVLVMSPMHQEVRIWLPTSPASRRPCWPPFRHYPPTRTAEPLQLELRFGSISNISNPPPPSPMIVNLLGQSSNGP